MKLIVGLGNVGKQYENTRHNMGFIAIDEIAKAYNVVICKSKFDGLYGEKLVNNEKIIFLKPQLFINLSGQVIKKYIDFFKLKTDDILIIHDDLDLPIGSFKIKPSGSSAGHNGLKDIENNLKTKDYKRIKIGISNDKTIDTRDFVLGKLNEIESMQIGNIINLMPNIFADYLEVTFENLMSKYNKHN